jgi:hypothetical protein
MEREDAGSYAKWFDAANKEVEELEKRRMLGSQDEYCRGCILVPGCNVVLKDGESCGDKYDGAVQPIDYRMNEMEYDEWEALGDNVPGKV